MHIPIRNMYALHRTLVSSRSLLVGILTKRFKKEHPEKGEEISRHIKRIDDELDVIVKLIKVAGDELYEGEQ